MIRALAILAVARLWIAIAGAGPQFSDSEYDLFLPDDEGCPIWE